MGAAAAEAAEEKRTSAAAAEEAAAEEAEGAEEVAKSEKEKKQEALLAGSWVAMVRTHGSFTMRYCCALVGARLVSAQHTATTWHSYFIHDDPSLATHHAHPPHVRTTAHHTMTYPNRSSSFVQRTAWAVKSRACSKVRTWG